MKRLLTVVFAVLTICSAYAEPETTYIFCAKADGSHWRWLTTDEGNRIPISGQWGRSTKPDGVYFDYFNISEEAYNFLKQACQLIFASEYVPQPADNLLDDWYVFLVTRPDGSQFLADGRYDVTSRQLAPINLPSSAFRL
ncbi:hypothetical protein H0A36_25245 [Endozoicomonas sp. SM1973]|uniref:Uncharacterized protein n=1 Tax=Spartinivicinus marinus TaxID=2994442 RepID=A0A853I5Z6_9GAMM|nr:hypothetical protein [Spartinivicinus marinus]MCX4027577.1 hypothetical protein [Spartinivicinus marinus]NYZ69330.1 hypothetical protein [Spartinivicinus marinus]